MNKIKSIVWFRQDLRLKDNPALHFGAKHGEILPIFIQDTKTANITEMGGASKWWLHHSLDALNQALDDKLAIFSGDPLLILQQLAETLGVDQILWNRCYEAGQIERDTLIKKTLASIGLTVKSFNGSLLWEPMSINKADGTPYKVFTPYYRKGCLSAPAPRYPLDAPDIICIDVPPSAGITPRSLASLNLLPRIPWDQGFAAIWQPGERGASERLSQFLINAVTAYRDQRNLPAVSGTSMLSPHIRWGELSPNQIWYATLDKFNGAKQEGVDTFLSEIGWREFSYYLLFHHPNIATANVVSRFDSFPWREDTENLARWQRGQTGIPIVDAGMRELWQTGYMHNRMRMVVGSFLVKNLLIDWRHGERWFWDCLCDADAASNSASWQWVAGCGADAAPYFRIFNPVLQGEKFDKQGEYVRHYCPELSDLPNKFIHKPWEAPEAILKQANIQLGSHYPEPIVDLKSSRLRALAAFESLKQVT